MSRSVTKPNRFVRQQVMRNPNISNADIVKAWESAKHKGKAPSAQLIYIARNAIKVKYGLDNLSDIPRNGNDFDVQALVRLLIKKNPETTVKRVQNALETDGVKVSKEDLAFIQEQLASPDANQNSGPRTRLKGKPGRKPGKQTGRPKKVEASSSLEDLENQLDELIAKAGEITNSDVVAALKNARRRVGQLLVN